MILVHMDVSYLNSNDSERGQKLTQKCSRMHAFAQQSNMLIG